MSDEFTAEEQAALDAMQEDTAASEPSQEAREAETQPSTPETPEEQEQELQSERETGQGKPPKGFVPHGAMHKEREGRKQLQDEVAELRAKVEALQSPPEAPPEWVDPIVDPEGHKRWQDHQSAQVQKRFDEIEAQGQQRAQIQERVSRATAYEQEFSKQTEDYYQAMQFLRNSRVEELRGMGYKDAEIRQQIAKDTNEIFDAGESIGMNPAQLAYYRAKELGYTAAVSSPTPAERITAQAQAQQATQGLGQGGGAPQAGSITAEQIAGMSEAEFDKLSDDEIAKAMGA